jgi:hypothetical protein
MPHPVWLRLANGIVKRSLKTGVIKIMDAAVKHDFINISKDELIKTLRTAAEERGSLVGWELSIKEDGTFEVIDLPPELSNIGVEDLGYISGDEPLSNLDKIDALDWSLIGQGLSESVSEQRGEKIVVSIN